MPLLLRWTRLADWSAYSVDDICNQEFRSSTDVFPSVYEATDADVIRVYAEHLASDRVKRDPRTGHLVDLSVQSYQALATDGETLFNFTTRIAHREIQLSDSATLRAFIEEILKTFAGRVRRVEKAQLKAYVAAQHAAGDPEWIDLCNNRSSWKKLVGP